MEVKREQQNTRRELAAERRRAKLIRRRKMVLTVMCFLCIYLAITVLSIQLRLRQQRLQLEQVQQAIQAAREENDELIRILNGGEEEYIERIAREKLGYAAVDERVYEDISGIG